MPELTDKKREMVLAVRIDPESDLFKSPARKPWYPCNDAAVIDAWLGKATVAFLPRSIAETNTCWRHFCTYSILRDGDRYFTYRRGSSGSEGRLHGLLSLGVGGHVGVDDYVNLPLIGEHLIGYAAEREIHEEIDGSGVGMPLDLVGLIADDSTSVNRVHLGVVYMANVDRDFVEPSEDCLTEPAWMTTAELKARRSEFEVWSQICIQNLIGGAV